MSEPFYEYSYKGQYVRDGLRGYWKYADPQNENDHLLRIPTIRELCDAYWRLRKEDEFNYGKYFERVRCLEAEKEKDPDFSFLYEIKPPMEEYVGKVVYLTRAYTKLIDEQIIRLVSCPLSTEDRRRINDFNEWLRELRKDRF